MRVLLLHPHDLRYDPWTIRIVELARGLSARGHHAIVAYLPKKKIHSQDRLLREGPPAEIDAIELAPRHSDLWRNYQTIQDLTKDCDLIHIQKCFSSVACPALWAAFRAGKPVHWDWDDCETALADMTAPDRLWAHLIGVWERRLARLVDSLSVSSEGVRELAAAYGFPAERICKVPVGADLGRFHPRHADPGLRTELGISDETLLAVYCGQLEGAAYAGLAIEAIQKARRKGVTVHLVVAGGGKGLPRLRELLAETPDCGCTLLGYVRADEVPRYLASADLGIACFEDNAATRCKSPLKIAEYLASGLPILGSDVGEVQEMIGDAGTVVPAGDSERLAEAIAAYHQNPERLADEARRARERAETTYHWQRSADILLERYEKLLSNR